MADPNQPYTAAIFACKASKEKHKEKTFMLSDCLWFGIHFAHFTEQKRSVKRYQKQKLFGLFVLIFILSKINLIVK